jgi:SAM-dependent methyltransferase
MQDLKLEKDWHEQKFYVDSGHWSSLPLFASRERHWLKNDQQKIRFYGYLHKYLKTKNYDENPSILFAPIGEGDDFKYVNTLSKKIHGIDISSTALDKCPKCIVNKEADILNSGFEDASFDVVICSFFLHHVHEVGFQPFLREFLRILRRKGTVAILEPSSMYPLRLLINPLDKLLGNVTGKVPTERPILPFKLCKDIKEVGFKEIKIVGQTFNHVRFPVSIQLLVNLLDYPLRYLTPFCYFSETIGYYATKP